MSCPHCPHCQTQPLAEQLNKQANGGDRCMCNGMPAFATMQLGREPCPVHDCTCGSQYANGCRIHSAHMLASEQLQ